MSTTSSLSPSTAIPFGMNIRLHELHNALHVEKEVPLQLHGIRLHSQSTAPKPLTTTSISNIQKIPNFIEPTLFKRVASVATQYLKHGGTMTRMRAGYDHIFLESWPWCVDEPGKKMAKKLAGSSAQVARATGQVADAVAQELARARSRIGQQIAAARKRKLCNADMQNGFDL
ncbi:hypothetical protein MBM_03831 [Drepanopeziza brunnea f. sp. 'multigermtubi' MB_m1]|uniref:Uncharacterized protein n=2 Tax=Drepanopeziza brunnea f. sp. 'multigermtubi' TaxID=698441 RepID=K1XZ01_MARBU|nr:uncharacterized protein MBM_03831 [Drepanopeziza brunnea f. sp. 'multigermtubi' MB_m1]EKD18059.1 hypothetical protein MBM_03831 [Drepanopeziza brunnea f. sp. 'multigermtubi' MB_m1]